MDYFSNQADYYARYRPHYPVELYEYLFGHVEKFNCAWDCGTGNGQVASVLVKKFKKVIATDISAKQIEKAILHERIDYQVADEANVQFNQPVDLVCIAQAIHWMDLEKLRIRLSQVTHSNSIISYWGYHLVQINEKLNTMVADFHNNTVGDYWPEERKLLLNYYRDIPFNLHNEQKVNFHYSANWTLSHFLGYLNSWSSVQQFIKKNGYNPVDDFKTLIEPFWKGSQLVTFPIFLTLGKLK